MANVYELSDVWDDAGVDWTAIKMDVVDTGSGAGSRLLDLRIGGISKASISKAGAMALAGGLTVGGAFDVRIGGTSYLSASASGAFATTPPVNDNSQRIATTAFVLAQMAAGRNRVQVEAYGAVADSIIVDNTAAINAAEAAAKLLDATVEFRDGLPYYYQGTLVAARDRLSWSGRNTQLIYNGANTTRNHFVLGDGVTAYRDCLITGIEFGSVTVMTAGTCVWARLLCRSILDIETQAQELNETLGNNLWNAVWIDGFDNVTLSGEAYTAQNDVIRINGAAGSGPKAEMFLEVRKAFDGLCGVRIGGGAGGVYFGWSTIELNLNNVVIDQTLLAEANREVMLQNATLDYPQTGGNNLVVDDAGFVQIQVASAWIGSAPNHNVWIKNCGGNVSMGGGYRIYGAGVDAVRVDDADAVVLLGSGQIHGSGGYGVNPTVSGHRVVIDGAMLFSNTLGNVNLTYAPAARSFSNYAEFTDILAGRVQAPQMFVDANFGSYLSGGNPFTAYDTNDYANYDRTANRYGWFVAGGQVAAFSTAGISVGPGNDTILTREASDTLGLRRGTNAQNFFVSGTWTDAANFERGVVGWNTSNFDINTAQAGTGTSRNLRLYTTGAGEVQLGVNSNISWKIGSGGHWLANTDGAYNIGASGANRPNNIYAANNIVASVNFQTGGDGSFNWSSRSVMRSPVDGNILFTNAAATGFGLHQYGGTTASFPAWKRNAAGFQARLADDSALTSVEASNLFSTSVFLANAGVAQWGSDVKLYRDAAAILALRDGTAAQSLRVFNTYTDALNWENLAFAWSAGVAYIATDRLGTGSNRQMVIRAGNQLSLSGSSGSNEQWAILSSGHLRASSHNTYDLGQTATRVRTGWFGTSVFAETSIGIGVSTAASPLTVQSASVAAPLATFNDGTGFALAYFGSAVDTPTGRGYLVLQNPGVDGNGSGIQFRSNNGGNNGVFSLDGTGNMVFRIQNGSGTVLTFDNFGTNSNNAIWFRTGGANTRFIIANNGNITVNLSTATFGWSDVLMARDAANTLALRNGANAQAFRVYETYTDASNYSRLAVAYQNSAFEIVAEKLGTGASRNLRLGASGTGSLLLATNGVDRWFANSSGHFLAATDNTYDFGASGANRVRSIYVGTSVLIGNATLTNSSGNNLSVGGAVFCANTSAIGSTARGYFQFPADGVFLMTNNAGTDFGRLQGGGTTNAFPAWKRSGAGWDARLADDSGLTFVGASSVVFNGQATVTADASHILALRNAGNAQTFRIYNTITDFSNYERASVSWGSNVFSIRTGGAGTGVQRAFVVDGSTFTVATGGTDRWTFDASGHQIPQADNAYNLGSATQRISQAFFVNPFIYANTPAFTIVEKDEAADGKVWNLRVNGGVMTWGIETDGYTGAVNFLSVTRAGLTVSNVTLTAGAISLVAPVTVTSVKTTPVLFSALPSAATAGAGTHAYITDATVAFTGANIGSIAAGGGANKSPVTSDGANWLIG